MSEEKKKKKPPRDKIIVHGIGEEDHDNRSHIQPPKQNKAMVGCTVAAGAMLAGTMGLGALWYTHERAQEAGDKRNEEIRREIEKKISEKGSRVTLIPMQQKMATNSNVSIHNV